MLHVDPKVIMDIYLIQNMHFQKQYLIDRH